MGTNGVGEPRALAHSHLTLVLISFISAVLQSQLRPSAASRASFAHDVQAFSSSVSIFDVGSLTVGAEDCKELFAFVTSKAASAILSTKQMGKTSIHQGPSSEWHQVRSSSHSLFSSNCR